MQHNVAQPLLYLAALVIAVLAFALYRIMNSDPHVAMRAMRRELEQAKKLLEEYRLREEQWTKDMALANTRWQNAERELEQLVSEVDRMKTRLEERLKTIDVQAGIIQRGEQYQKAQQERIEYLIGRVIQMDAEKGIVTKLPWNE